MSLHKELKGIDDELRSAMTRRDRLRKVVNKHDREVEVTQRKIKKANEALANLQESTAENNASWTDHSELHEEYASKARDLLAKAEEAVNKRLDEIGAP